jgi:ketosteroid isomerase-like protein
MAIYWNSPEVVLYPPDGLEARGYDAVRQAWQGTFAALPGAKFESVDPHFMAAGDTVVSWGRYRVTPVGAPAALEGRFTVVAAQRDGKWVWIFDHGSFPLPPPPAPPAPAPTDAPPATPPG